MAVVSCPHCGTPQNIPTQWPDESMPCVVCFSCQQSFDPFSATQPVSGAALPSSVQAGTHHGGGDESSSSMTFSIGSCCGIPVRVHNFMLALVAVQAFYGLFQGLSIGSHFAMLLFAWNFLLYGPILFGTVLIHELGHCAAAKYVGGHAEEILLWPLGGLAYVAHSSGYADDMKVALAGPLTHIPQASFWLALQAMSGPISLSMNDDIRTSTGFFHSLCTAALVIQLSLFAFNLLLPAYPLDGGRVFADALLLYGMDVNRAAVITAVIAMVIALGICGWGVLSVLQGNPFALMTVFVGAWVLWNSHKLYEMGNHGDAKYHPMFGNQMEELGSR